MNKNLEALKPCPFCGGKPYVLAAGQSSTGINMVRCDYCGARMYGYDIPKAVETWNRRSPTTLPTVEELQDMIGRAKRSWAEQDSYPTPFGFAKSFNEHLALYVQGDLTRRMGGES